MGLERTPRRRTGPGRARTSRARCIVGSASRAEGNVIGDPVVSASRMRGGADPRSSVVVEAGPRRSSWKQGGGDRRGSGRERIVRKPGGADRRGGLERGEHGVLGQELGEDAGTVGRRGVVDEIEGTPARPNSVSFARMASSRRVQSALKIA